MKICAHSERYRILMAGIFQIHFFFWQHRVSTVIGLTRLVHVREMVSFESRVETFAVPVAMHLLIGLILDIYVALVFQSLRFLL